MVCYGCLSVIPLALWNTVTKIKKKWKKFMTFAWMEIDDITWYRPSLYFLPIQWPTPHLKNPKCFGIFLGFVLWFLGGVLGVWGFFVFFLVFFQMKIRFKQSSIYHCELCTSNTHCCSGVFSMTSRD